MRQMQRTVVTVEQSVMNRPLQNRVDPWGQIVAVPERGSLFGNRGVLHDESGTIVRNHQVKRWISCELEFKNRRRPLLRPGHYTELFIADEATALAAGHRPCFECRRQDAVAFQAAWRRAFDLDHTPRVAEMDAALHEARRSPGDIAQVADLPSGVMVERDGRAWLRTTSGLAPWSHAGYGEEVPAEGPARLLTPQPIVATIEAGYVVRPRKPR